MILKILTPAFTCLDVLKTGKQETGEIKPVFDPVLSILLLLFELNLFELFFLY